MCEAGVRGDVGGQDAARARRLLFSSAALLPAAIPSTRTVLSVAHCVLPAGDRMSSARSAGAARAGSLLAPTARRGVTAKP